MSTVNRPPSAITPSEFFETWLPQEYARLKAASTSAPPDLVACMHLTGEGGGDWTLTMVGGQLSVTRKATDPADVRIAQTVADWRAITVGEPGAGPDLTPPEAVSLDRWLINPALQQTLQSVRGTLRLEIPGFRGRTFAIEITFHGGAEPRATISIDADTVAAIRAGTLPAMQAFFAGKVLITGDSALAMQIGMAVMTPPGQ